jgi:hypothetical protein
MFYPLFILNLPRTPFKIFHCIRIGVYLAGKKNNQRVFITFCYTKHSLSNAFI